jgi:hypothetical protein
MKRLLVLAGIVLALVTTTNNAQGGTRPANCMAPIIVSN